MEFKGTKNNWSVTEIKKGLGEGIHISCGKKFFLCKINKHEDCFTIEEAKANAQLISCAPEMLEMLEDVKDYLGSDVREKVEQLIKKATEIWK
jgi:hypothetical protein